MTVEGCDHRVNEAPHRRDKDDLTSLREAIEHPEWGTELRSVSGYGHVPGLAGEWCRCVMTGSGLQQVPSRPLHDDKVDAKLGDDHSCDGIALFELSRPVRRRVFGRAKSIPQTILNGLSGLFLLSGRASRCDKAEGQK